MPRGWRPKPTEEEKLEAAKKKRGAWNFEDLYRLRAALKLSAETAAKMLGA